MCIYIARAKWPSKNGKIYESIYLRQSYREGRKVKQRNIAKLAHCPAEVIGAIELALKNKGDLAALKSLKKVELIPYSPIEIIAFFRKWRPKNAFNC